MVGLRVELSTVLYLLGEVELSFIDQTADPIEGRGLHCALVVASLIGI